MNFEYNIIKSEVNRQKHGLSLEEAKQLWLASAVEIQARTVGEARFLRIGKIQGVFYSCVYTVRGEVIRLISARRSRAEEEAIYKEKVDEETTEEENQGK